MMQGEATCAVGSPFTENLYGRLARYYDPVHRSRPYDDETRFAEFVFRQHARSRGTRTIDLFCGTGGHSIPASRQGLLVVGLDMSAEMLRIARAKAAAARVDVDFRHGDCRSLGYRNEFDLAFGLGQSFHYLTSYTDVRLTLEGVGRALKPGGVCVIDFINGWRMLEPYRAEQRDIADDGTEIIRFVHTYPDRRRRIAVNESTWIIGQPDGYSRLERTVEEYRIFFQDELEWLLELSGLQSVATYGGHSIDAVDIAGGLFLTIVARKV
jgi:SAM-dependent methyltransferase